MSKELIEFINLLLVDGEISEKEKIVIFEEAKRLGVSENACDVILSSLMGSIPKEVNDKTKKVPSKKVPKFQKRANLDKRKSLENDIDTSANKQNEFLKKSEQLLNDLSELKLTRDEVLVRSKGYEQIRETLKKEYLGVLKNIQASVEGELGSRAEKANQSSLLYKADEMSLISFYQSLTWDYSTLANKRRSLIIITKLLFWFLWVVLFSDWFFWEEGEGGFFNFITTNRWLGFEWYTILGASLMFAVFSGRYEKQLNSNTMDFNEADVMKAVKKSYTSEVKSLLKLYNSIDDELRKLSTNLKYKTNLSDSIKKFKELQSVIDKNKIYNNG